MTEERTLHTARKHSESEHLRLRRQQASAKVWQISR